MKRIAFSVLVLMSSVAWGDPAVIVKNLSKVIPDLQQKQISKTPVEGLYQVILGARVFYTSADGRYLIQGEMLDVVARENMTAQTLKVARKQSLAVIPKSSIISFPAEKPKKTITVFSDIDCGYCRKLHAQMDDYNALGITVNYLLFPRTGPQSESYNKAVSVWCAEDRNEALTDAKLNDKVVNKTCDHPVNEHIKLGLSFGVTGTPAIVAEDGTMIPGFVPPKELAKQMGWAL